MPRGYNFIYKQIVESEDDIIGHIAYSLYKSNKIEFIEQFKEEHEGREPEDADFETFHRTTCLERSVKGYKEMANGILQRFMTVALEEQVNHIEEKSLRAHEKMIKDAVEPLKPKKGFWAYIFGASQSVVGAIMFALILGITGVIVKFKLNDVNFTYGEEQQKKELVFNPVTKDSIPNQEVSSYKQTKAAQ